MNKRLRFILFFLAVLIIPSLCQASVTILTNTNPEHTIISGSDEQVYGTSASNQIILESGAKAELINFPGQNDIQIQSDSNLFTVSRSGTVVCFEGSDGTVLNIPATSFVQTISFNDDINRILHIHDNQIMLDDQVIAETNKVVGDVCEAPNTYNNQFLIDDASCEDKWNITIFMDEFYRSQLKASQDILMAKIENESVENALRNTAIEVAINTANLYELSGKSPENLIAIGTKKSSELVGKWFNNDYADIWSSAIGTAAATVISGGNPQYALEYAFDSLLTTLNNLWSTITISKLTKEFVEIEIAKNFLYEFYRYGGNYSMFAASHDLPATVDKVDIIDAIAGELSYGNPWWWFDDYDVSEINWIINICTDTVNAMRNEFMIGSQNSFTCGAYIAPGVWKEFDCYNLAAIGKTTKDDPFTPSWRLIGGYWQWGRKGPDQTKNDWYKIATEHFAPGPTGDGSMVEDANAGSIIFWDTISAPDGAWKDDEKTANDPCPEGYRVPTRAQWDAFVDNNTQSKVGTWSSSATNYTSALYLGSDLMLPAAGYRYSNGGELKNRGDDGYYWSSLDYSGLGYAWHLRFSSYNTGTSYVKVRRNGFSVRCVAE